MTAVIPTASHRRRRLPTLRRVMRDPLGATSVIILALITAAAVFGPVLITGDPNLSDVGAVLAPPSPEHPLGTDGAGRDVLTRLLYGGRVTLAAALLAAIVSIAIGLPAGLLAGFYRGRFDTAANWVIGVLMSLPAIIILLAVRAAIGPNVWVSMIVFGIILVPSVFRLTRTAVLSVRAELYIDAALVFGVSDARIIARHVLSVVRAPVIIQTARLVGIAITIQSGLEFLGLGDRVLPTWGQMLAEGFRNIYVAPLLLVWPCVAIVLTVVSLAVLGNALRDALEDDEPVRARPVPRPVPAPGLTPVIAPVTTAVAALTPDRQSAILSVRDLTIAYPIPGGEDRVVVNNVGLSVARGEVLALVGESGSGKTQTAFALLGLLPRSARILGGALEFEHQTVDLHGAPEKARTRMAYIPQEPMTNLDPNYTIGHQLARPMVLSGRYTKKAARARGLELLDRVGIRDPQRVYGARSYEISGGMAQRVLIAGAISTDPALLIADEPTTALDVTVQAEILDILRTLQADLGMAVILVTHNFGVVADLCDHVAVMRNGSIVETGSVRDVLLHPTHPYTQALIQATLEDKPPLQPLGVKVVPQ